MRAFRIPAALLVAAALALGCNQGTPASPNTLGPQFSVHVNDPTVPVRDVDLNEDGRVCLLALPIADPGNPGDGNTCSGCRVKAGPQLVDNNLPDADGDDFGECPDGFVLELSG